MKFLFAIIPIAILVAACNTASLSNSSRANLVIGWRQPGEILLRRANVSLPAIPNVIQFQDYEYRGDFRTFISAVIASENGWTQNAVAYVVSGGIGQSNVSIRMQTARGRGFNYTIELYGLYY